MSTAAKSVSLPLDSEEDEECKNLISSLPRERWYGSTYLHNYKGFWLGPVQLPGIIAFQKHFQAQDSDVLLATMPKSGTTWLKAIVFALLNRKKYPITQDNHPLLTKNPHCLVPMVAFLKDFSKQFPEFSSTSRRIYATHSPIILLPESVNHSSACKMVYLCRNPKDVFVSYWHFSKKLGLEDDTSLEDFFDMFCEGVSFSGPYWDHVLGYWRESLEKPQKVFFLKYEDIQEQPSLYLRCLAEFLGCRFTLKEETSGAVDQVLRLCSFDNLSNLEVNKKGKTFTGYNEVYFRKGEVGDWKNYLTSEMANRLDQISLQKLNGSGLNL